MQQTVARPESQVHPERDGAAAAASTDVPPFPLFRNERVIRTHGGRTAIVTTARVRSYADGVGNSSMVSLMLDEIASCSVTSLSKPSLLAVAAIVAVASFALSGEGRVRMWGLLLAAGFAVAYFLTRRQVIAIRSAGASINIDVAGTDERVAYDLIDAIEAAKESRALK